MNHVMIDLETLGTAEDAIFFSCGACFFNPATGDIGDKYYQSIDIQSSIDAGRSFSASTLKWWMGQSDDARKKIQEPGIPLAQFLKDFADFTGTGSIVWGNGSVFDISILNHAYGEYRQPWKFWNVMDVRTICALAHPAVTKDHCVRKGVHHNALDDAIYQAEYVSKMWKHIKR